MHSRHGYLSFDTYRVISNGNTSLFIAPDGAIDWACGPDFQSPAVFSRLLDAEHGGYFQVAPAEQALSGMQRYLNASNVLQTRFSDTNGEILLTDFMPLATSNGQSSRQRLPDAVGRHSLVRIVTCLHGEMPTVMRLKALANTHPSSPEVTLLAENKGALISGAYHLALAIVGAHLLPSFTLAATLDEGECSPTVNAQAVLREGERLLFALGASQSASVARFLAEDELHQRDFYTDLAQTLHHWRSRLPCSPPG